MTELAIYLGGVAFTIVVVVLHPESHLMTWRSWMFAVVLWPVTLLAMMAYGVRR